MIGVTHRTHNPPPPRKASEGPGRDVDLLVTLAGLPEGALGQLALLVAHEVATGGAPGAERAFGGPPPLSLSVQKPLPPKQRG